MPDLAPSDLRKPSNQSGYAHVQRDNQKKAFRAQAEGTGDKPFRTRWYGPRRATALESAWDYCNYVNAGQAVARAVLVYPKQPKRLPLEEIPRDPEVEYALGVLRDHKAQQAGKQGYVYCIGEASNLYAVKIGYSVNPPARVRELQTGNPRPLVLLGWGEGTEADEAGLHMQFLQYNLLGEWFIAAPDVLDVFGLDENGQPHD